MRQSTPSRVDSYERSAFGCLLEPMEQRMFLSGAPGFGYIHVHRAPVETFSALPVSPMVWISPGQVKLSFATDSGAVLPQFEFGMGFEAAVQYFRNVFPGAFMNGNPEASDDSAGLVPSHP